MPMHTYPSWVVYIPKLINVAPILGGTRFFQDSQGQGRSSKVKGRDANFQKIPSVAL